MDFLQPTSWADALAARAERPDALAIAGGTDVMVDLNFDRRRPGALLDLGRVPELREWSTEDGWVRLGAGVSYTRVIDDLAVQLPGLAMAARTVGSPQIRIRGTVGGNLGSAAPTPRRALEAEEFLAGELESAGLWDSRRELPETLARAFGERVAAAASPIDDVRGSAAYRRHSLSVMARRAATWAWNDLRRAA